ncbi:MAG: hypothetical protein NC548_62500 [Lachnospiraceae bacterium]|nr:hypothetical protein [Lachnospiraceae bacterium]
MGIVDGFERSITLDPEDGIFCEIAPSGGYLPVRFRFDGDFLLNPPPNVRLYFTENAVCVYCFGFLYENQTLSVLFQKRIDGTLFTLCRQGTLQLNMENETGFHLLPISGAFENCTVKPYGSNYLLEGDGGFLLLSRNGKTLVKSEGKILEAGETLRAEVPFHDSMGHTAVCEWQGDTLVSSSIRTACEPSEATFALALFESALIGADCKPFLAESLIEKADALQEFLGDYRSVVLTGEKDKIGLVYERKERIFDVRYFRVSVTDGKVSNIRPV